jgi:CMP-N-acetylneuraminic acid synthetase
VGGVPLVARSVYAALGAKSVDAVFVSTDCSNIAKAAKDAGATVIMRPDELATDLCMAETAILHVLSIISTPSTVVYLQCTSPFTTSQDIDAAVDAFVFQQADSLVSVVPTHGFLWTLDEARGALPVNHDFRVRPRRQDLDPQYLENGAIYVMDVPGFLTAKHRFFGKIGIYVMSPDKFLEIDTPFDMYLAQMMDWHHWDYQDQIGV